MPALPDFHPGQRWSQLQSAELRELVEQVERNSKIIGGPGILVQRTASGLTVGLSPKGPQAVKPVSFACLVIRELEDDDKTIRIRKVRYRDIPPQLDEYEWDGVDFEAYPDIGHSILDFEGLVQEEGELPNADSSFVRARYVEGSWLVWIPSDGGATRFVVAREKQPDSTATTIMVSPVEHDTENDRYSIDDDASIRIFTWPNLTRGDFAPLAQPTGDTVVDATNILAAVQFHQAFYLMQNQRFAYVLQDHRFDLTECLPIPGP